MGIDIDFVDFGNEDDVQSKLKSGNGKIKLFWLETPTNPTLILLIWWGDMLEVVRRLYLTSTN